MRWHATSTLPPATGANVYFAPRDLKQLIEVHVAGALVKPAKDHVEKAMKDKDHKEFGKDLKDKEQKELEDGSKFGENASRGAHFGDAGLKQPLANLESAVELLTRFITADMRPVPRRPC